MPARPVRSLTAGDRNNLDCLADLSRARNCGASKWSRLPSRPIGSRATAGSAATTPSIGLVAARLRGSENTSNPPQALPSEARQLCKPCRALVTQRREWAQAISGMPTAAFRVGKADRGASSGGPPFLREPVSAKRNNFQNPLPFDSRHVCKIGSDVNHAVFKMLPVLQASAFRHFHDILFPFEFQNTGSKIRSCSGTSNISDGVSGL
jgi:hypothetical protein